MSTYISLNVHVIFATRGRNPAISNEWRPELHRYLGGTITGLGGVPLVVGGVADHVHLLLGLKATQAVSDFVREVKKSSSNWSSQRSHGFAWQSGYGAFSVSPKDLPTVIDYIARQEDHHRTVSSSDELLALLEQFGVSYDPQFFE